MKYWPVSLISLLVSLVWADIVFAQSPTPEPPTATPVVTQIWPGPTRTPLGDLGGCDPKLTPDPNAYDLEYRFNCGHCFPKPTLSGSTSTPWPTVAMGTGTPGTDVPSGTGTPQATVSVTPTPTAEHEYYLGQTVHVSGSLPYHQADLWRNIGHILTIEIPENDEFRGIVLRNVNVLIGHVTYRLGEENGATWRYDNVDANQVDPGGAGCWAEYWHGNMCEVLGITKKGRVTYGPGIGGDMQLSVHTSGYWGGIAEWDFDIEIWYKGVGEIGGTPTPEPTPSVEAGFCSDGGSHVIGEVYSEILPPVYIRDGVCLTIIPSIDAIEPFIPDNWTVSEWTGVQVCTQYVGLGVVKLFGYDVYMLHYLTAGAAVAIIRRIMKG